MVHLADNLPADHILFLAYPDDVGIGIIGIQYRIDVGTIPLVAPSHLQLLRLLLPKAPPLIHSSDYIRAEMLWFPLPAT